MKKRILISFICILILVSILAGIYLPKNSNKNLTKIRLAEVTHSSFYAPLYVAIENDYFKDEGIGLISS